MADSASPRLSCRLVPILGRGYEVEIVCPHCGERRTIRMLSDALVSEVCRCTLAVFAVSATLNDEELLDHLYKEYDVPLKAEEHNTQPLTDGNQKVVARVAAVWITPK